MNGQDLLEAMSFIDESYIHQMETVQKPRRKVLRWQPVAVWLQQACAMWPVCSFLMC